MTAAPFPKPPREDPVRPVCPVTLNDDGSCPVAEKTYDQHRTHRRVRMIVGYLIFVVVFTGAVSYGIYHADHQANTAVERTQPFAPLSHEPPIVTDAIPGVAGPAVHLGEPVHIVSVVTNSAGRPVPTLASVLWQATTPAGVAIPGSAASLFSGNPETRAPGQQSRVITLPMPVDAMQEERDLDAAHVAHRWRIVGSATPLRPNGTTGTRDQFATSLITVVS